MHTEKQKLEKFQAKFARIEKQTEELRKIVNLTKVDEEWQHVPAFCEYLLCSIEKVLLRLERITKK